MPNVGSVQDLIKYSSADVSVIPDNLNTLNLSGKKKICISIVGDVTGTADLINITLDVALGSRQTLPMTDGAVSSNAKIQITDAMKGTDSACTYVYDIEGYSELALVSLALSSGTLSGTVYIEAV